MVSSCVVHDASEVVRRIPDLGIAVAVEAGACVVLDLGLVLACPAGCNRVPMYGEMGTMPVVLLCGVHPLLLMLHAKRVPDLVDHVAHVRVVLAPAEVERSVPDAHPRDVAGRAVDDVHLYENVVVRFGFLFLQHDAS